MRIGQEQIFLRDVVRILHPNVIWEFCQHPNPFPFSQGPGGVIPQRTFGDDSVEKPERLVVLNGNVAVPNDSQNTS